MNFGTALKRTLAQSVEYEAFGGWPYSLPVAIAVLIVGLAFQPTKAASIKRVALWATEVSVVGYGAIKSSKQIAEGYEEMAQATCPQCDEGYMIVHQTIKRHLKTKDALTNKQKI